MFRIGTPIAEALAYGVLLLPTMAVLEMTGCGWWLEPAVDALPKVCDLPPTWMWEPCNLWAKSDATWPQISLPAVASPSLIGSRCEEVLKRPIRKNENINLLLA